MRERGLEIWAPKAEIRGVAGEAGKEATLSLGSGAGGRMTPQRALGGVGDTRMPGSYPSRDPQSSQVQSGTQKKQDHPGPGGRDRAGGA